MTDGLLTFFIGSVVAAASAGGRESLAEIIMAGLAIGGAFWWRSRRKKAESRILQRALLAYRERVAADGFLPDYLYIAPSGRSFIAIDETRAAVKIGGGDEISQSIVMRWVEAGEILGTSIAENGNSTVTAVTLTLILDDMTAPIATMNFLDRKARRNSAFHREAQEDARLWQTRVELLRHRARPSQTTGDASSADSRAAPEEPVAVSDPLPET